MQQHDLRLPQKRRRGSQVLRKDLGRQLRSGFGEVHIVVEHPALLWNRLLETLLVLSGKMYGLGRRGQREGSVRSGDRIFAVQEKPVP